MTHKNHKQMEKNACQAIPDHDEEPMTLWQIYYAQARPKLPGDELKSILDMRIEAGEIEKTEVWNKGNNRINIVYRWRK